MFEEANGGTIFLDEMGELDPELQAKLLRVLESQQFLKVGDTKPTQVNVRILAATNRDLQSEIETNHFRSDLYYRLSVFQITLPPLRERKKDIHLAGRIFYAILCVESEKTGRHDVGGICRANWKLTTGPEISANLKM